MLICSELLAPLSYAQRLTTLEFNMDRGYADGGRPSDMLEAMCSELKRLVQNSATSKLNSIHSRHIYGSSGIRFVCLRYRLNVGAVRLLRLGSTTKILLSLSKDSLVERINRKLAFTDEDG